MTQTSYLFTIATATLSENNKYEISILRTAQKPTDNLIWVTLSSKDEVRYQQGVTLDDQFTTEIETGASAYMKKTFDPGKIVSGSRVHIFGCQYKVASFGLGGGDR